MLKRCLKRRGKKDISYLHKNKKFKEDKHSKCYVCVLHENNKEICGFYDCSGVSFRSEEKKENKEYLS